LRLREHCGDAIIKLTEDFTGKQAERIDG